MNSKRSFLLALLFTSVFILPSLPFFVKAAQFSNFLSVQYFSQQESYYCGPATVQMALGYLLSSVPSQDELASELQTDAATGVTYESKMRTAFDSRGYTQVRNGTLNVESLKDMNSEVFLTIILIYFDKTHEYQHYVLVVGYDSNGIYVHDPWPTSWKQPQGRVTGSNVSISYEVLSDLWSCRPSHWGLSIPYVKEVAPAIPWWQEYWYVLVALSAVAVGTGTLIWARSRKSMKEEKVVRSNLWLWSVCQTT
jgi:hypothetical protein